MMAYLFWVSLAVPMYAFFGYPLLVALLASRAPLSVGSCKISRPTVTIIIAAHNEEAYIAGKIRTLRSQTYPTELLEIVVASDGSSDETVSKVRQMGGVRVLDLPRLGKAGALNAAARVAKGDVLVFTDADNTWKKDTLEKLVEPFADATVGAVGGHIEIPDRGRSLGLGDRVYRKFESWLRDNEARAGFLVSVDGAVLAIRRELFEPVPPDVTDDFFISTAAPAHGFRIAFAPAAEVQDAGLEGGRRQFGRRVRVTVRGLQSLYVRRSLMNPLAHGRYAIGLISHKLLRRLAPLFLVPLLASSLALYGTNPFYTGMTLGQLGLYSAGFAGLLDTGRRLPKIFHLAGYGLISIGGLAWGVVKFLSGTRLQRWTPADNR